MNQIEIERKTLVWPPVKQCYNIIHFHAACCQHEAMLHDNILERTQHGTTTVFLGTPEVSREAKEFADEEDSTA
jgi:hypothetical protein